MLLSSLPLHPSSFYHSFSFSFHSHLCFPVFSSQYSVLHNEPESFWAPSRKSGRHVELSRGGGGGGKWRCVEQWQKEMRIREENMDGENGEAKKMRGEEEKRRQEFIGKKEEGERQRKERRKL